MWLWTDGTVKDKNRKLEMKKLALKNNTNGKVEVTNQGEELGLGAMVGKELVGDVQGDAEEFLSRDGIFKGE